MKQRRLILCRSQSEAMILSRTLSVCGIHGKLTRPPRSKKVRSCSWAIEIDSQAAGRAEACLSSHQIPRNIWCWEDCDAW